LDCRLESEPGPFVASGVVKDRSFLDVCLLCRGVRGDEGILGPLCPPLCLCVMLSGFRVVGVFAAEGICAGKQVRSGVGGEDGQGEDVISLEVSRWWRRMEFGGGMELMI
jgi:hypothetical protein